MALPADYCSRPAAAQRSLDALAAGDVRIDRLIGLASGGARGSRRLPRAAPVRPGNAGARLRSDPRADFSAACAAERQAAADRAVLGGDPVIHSGGGEPWAARPGRRRPAPLVGQPAAASGERLRSRRRSLGAPGFDVDCGGVSLPDATHGDCGAMKSFLVSSNNRSLTAAAGITQHACLRNSLASRGRKAAVVSVFLASAALAANGSAQYGGELRFCLYSEPKTFNPLLVQDASSETIRYLTAGVLVRVNRQTQEAEPELAISWRSVANGRGIAFKLRQQVSFSDGTPFTAEDVADTMRMLVDKKLNAPTGESFRAAGGSVKIETPSASEIILTFPAPIAGLERLFDQVGIVSSKSPKKEMASAGPFYVAEYKPGSEVRLARNPYYWKRDEQGRRLPRLDSVRLAIQTNREMEAMRFSRGELDLMTTVSPETFEQLHARLPNAVRDLGPSLESEMFWFNQAPKGPVPEYKKAWFRSKEFRRAISAAVNREDMCRLVEPEHARPAEGPISPANKFWFDTGLKPHAYNPKEARDRLAREGFRMQGDTLVDAQGPA